MEAKDYYLFRIVLIGDSGVGKTSIIRQCIDGRSVATHGFDFSTKSLRIGSSKVKVMQNPHLIPTIHFLIAFNRVSLKTNHCTGIWNGTMEWKMKSNGTVAVN